MSLDQLQGVHVVAEQVFVVEGERAQPLLWEEHGFRMHVPEDALLPSETCLISVKAIVAGFFQFPKGTEPVSAVYAISLSKKFYKPVKLELQHCVLLERPGQSKFMSFAVARHDQSSSLPYQFQPVAGGVFELESFFGSIDREQFCFMCIIWDWLGYSQKKQTSGDLGKNNSKLTPVLLCATNVFYRNSSP